MRAYFLLDKSAGLTLVSMKIPIRQTEDDTGPNTIAVMIFSVFYAEDLFSFHQKSSSPFLRPGRMCFMYSSDFLGETYVGFLTFSLSNSY